jgi:UDP-N-acetylmuramate--alanine ligase
MQDGIVPSQLRGVPVYFVGIKGTGMAALAELFQARGAVVSGSDGTDTFYTDEVLTALGIPYYEGFAAEQVPEKVSFVVYSAAYDPRENPELQAAVARGIPIIEYTAALGEVSARARSTGIAGVHGKTTTTALAGTLVRELALPGFVLVGSAVRGFGDRSTYVGGERYFIAETCEYRRHFLAYRPQRIVVTSVDADHLDYYRDAEDVQSAFVEYARLLPEGGELIYCADDPGAAETAHRAERERPDLRLIPYGFEAEGDFRILSREIRSGRQYFRLAGFGEEFSLRIPGAHTVLNAAAACAVAAGIMAEEGQDARRRAQDFARALESFRGSRRRSEILGEASGVLCVDDYGHHPREIALTLEGFRRFYPERRLIVDFMSHTYSRTEALFDQFPPAFDAADEVILHKIYASAREREGRIDGRELYRAVQERHGRVRYFHEVLDAAEYLEKHLRPGDLLITMGAGDNWRLSHEMLRRLAASEEAQR